MGDKPKEFEGLVDGSIDAGLFVLSLIIPRGVCLTQEEIAHVCGCTRGMIWLIEKQAKEKLRQGVRARRLRRAGGYSNG